MFDTFAISFRLAPAGLEPRALTPSLAGAVINLQVSDQFTSIVNGMIFLQ